VVLEELVEQRFGFEGFRFVEEDCRDEYAPGVVEDRFLHQVVRGARGYPPWIFVFGGLPQEGAVYSGYDDVVVVLVAFVAHARDQLDVFVEVSAQFDRFAHFSLKKKFDRKQFETEEISKILHFSKVKILTSLVGPG
jgi:hypothetical protein